MTHDHDLVLKPTARQTEAALNPPPGRTGGDLVVETLQGLGATTVFGLPGQHALGMFDALRRSSLSYVGLRVENNAGFAADAYGRITGEAAPLLLSTGPGALMSLAALQEAAAASAPVLAIGSQVPSAGLGGGRHGYLHELRDQQASFRDIVKSVHTARTASQIPSAIADAWRSALTAPHGPVWVEIPQDVLLAETLLPVVTAMDATPEDVLPRPELTALAAHLLAGAERPAIIAGGGVVRSDAAGKLLALAERLDAPVVTTFGGKGAFPWEHPLSLQSWLEDRHTTDFLEDADVLLVVGSGLGELSSNYHTFAPRGRVIQVEADAGKLEANHAGIGIHADARLALSALLETVPERPDPAAAERVRTVLAKVRERIAAQDRTVEQQLLAAVREALPDTSPSFWDMTILAYWAWSAFDARQPNTMHSAQGAGGLGYGFPAALGAAAADPSRPVLAVSGDGGAMYSIAELATARQYGLPVTWLIVDDGGYGILREYMTDAFGEATGTELARPDFVALAESFGVPAVRTAPETLAADLAKALAEPGPSVVVLPALLRMFAPTHL
ncbi:MULTISPECIES: thiamine pyrophosphate-binding protein [Streptomyces]|uniref:Thiamine pyrophosphate-binding protein n=1 Tax=Streptomyces tsukubensis (strain DSM 42081 / NBRC 108919 / NRRL 18488 / 9993) TaxID=1114943 RepID=I2MYK0_STRT9|nr:thiamine pyrophosphate-binding protein [Streptomyces tsukubensis]MYS63473.1 thiamine pyrophosphate-binding protein [Streptomyces sp. SID5473]AZK94160.1 acetolactate synthase [Streptomyces tsukubensis]EIF89847.1 acetolactate synthase [Streptomyces tsukubensis NRRL18488]QKM69737.1 thiamine pyrophosphate-binding protein [Streptomyces tsukubensis NRRL18488]TAI46298.1 thiamine pyrophosphate-binding protein [Streptomyces tsukubensis]